MDTRAYVDFLMTLLRQILVHPTLPKPIISLDPAQDPELPVGIFIGSQWCKIASVGIQVRRRITSHGFALNIEQECEQGFKEIVACGLKNTQLTSIQSVLSLPPGQPLVQVEDLLSPTVELFGYLSGNKMKEMDADCEGLDPIGYNIVKDFISSQ
jgi:lipoyl(octanoyl) transferase